jgi:hypothetical protein
MTDPRIAVLSALSSPDWHPVPEAHGMPWDEAEQLLTAYDASRAAAVPSAPPSQTAECPQCSDRAAVDVDELRRIRYENLRRAERAEAAMERVRSALESEAVVGRSALDYRGLITTALMADDASDPSRMAGEAQQPETQQGPPRPPSPRCAHCRHPKRDHDGRADHRANSSPLVAGDPWCHACNAECDYAEQSDFQERGDTARRAAGIDGTAGDAQDVPHAFVLDEPTGGCLLCGLSPTYRKHAVVSQPGKEA